MKPSEKITQIAMEIAAKRPGTRSPLAKELVPTPVEFSAAILEYLDCLMDAVEFEQNRNSDKYEIETEDVGIATTDLLLTMLKLIISRANYVSN